MCLYHDFYGFIIFVTYLLCEVVVSFRLYANLRPEQGLSLHRNWELRLWMKLCRSDNHHTMGTRKNLKRSFIRLTRHQEGMTSLNVSIVKFYDFYLFHYIHWNKARNVFQWIWNNYSSLKRNVICFKPWFLAFSLIEILLNFVERFIFY